MKTLKITLLAIGFLCASSVSAFTALNLPLDKLSTLNRLNPIAFDITKEVIPVVVPDKTAVLNKNLKDTILIDLRNDKVTAAFPTASKDCIMKQVPYPEFAREKNLEGGVTARFRFDNTGNVTVLETCSNSPELEQYVISKLTSLQLNNCVVDVNKDYYLRFMFRLF